MSPEEKREPFHSRFIQSRLLTWWSSLEHHKGERARLRRCRQPSEVLLQTGFFRFYQALDRPGHLDRTRLAAVCGLASHIRRNTKSVSLGGRMGRSNLEEKRPRISEARFRRLLNYETVPALYQPLIRIIRQLEYAVPLPDLVKAVYFWDREQTKEYLAFDYYETIPLQSQEAGS